MQNAKCAHTFIFELLRLPFDRLPETLRTA